MPKALLLRRVGLVAAAEDVSCAGAVAAISSAITAKIARRENWERE